MGVWVAELSTDGEGGGKFSKSAVNFSFFDRVLQRRLVQRLFIS